MRVELRPAGADDQAFFARVYAGTREEELAQVPFSAQEKEAFLAQQFAAQTAHYTTHYADAQVDVVVVDGEPAGRLMVHRSPGAIHIVDISLLPAFRGRGAGTRLLRALLDEAAGDAGKVTIYVERFNPALRLYQRLGFGQVTDEGVYLRLECVPGGVQAKTAS